MQSVRLKKPMVFLMLGYPGAGKTYFARQFAKHTGAVHLSSDRIRFELFEEPQFSEAENDVVNRLLYYMFDEVVATGGSVVFDANNNRRSQRKELADKARKQGAEICLVWVQTDLETSARRAANRDRRNPDDKYSYAVTSEAFDRSRKNLTKPKYEDYVVVSGKHVFRNQLHAVLKKLNDMQVLVISNANPRVALGGRVNRQRRVG